MLQILFKSISFLSGGVCNFWRHGECLEVDAGGACCKSFDSVQVIAQCYQGSNQCPSLSNMTLVMKFCSIVSRIFETIVLDKDQVWFFQEAYSIEGFRVWFFQGSNQCPSLWFPVCY